MRLLLALLISCFSLAHASTVITEIYEVGEGNVAITTKITHITNQYLYSPYGIQRNLNHPLKLKGPNTSYQKLDNTTRKPLNITHNQFGYTGQSADPSTGLMMLGGFRNYAPGIGRFIQPDTYNSFSKQGINNPDAYVTGNPLFFTDPNGHVEDAMLNAFNEFWDAVDPLNILINPGEVLQSAVATLESAARGNELAMGMLATSYAPELFSLSEAFARTKIMGTESGEFGALLNNYRLGNNRVSTVLTKNLDPAQGLPIPTFTAPLDEQDFGDFFRDRAAQLIQAYPSQFPYELLGSEISVYGAGQKARDFDLMVHDLRNNKVLLGIEVKATMRETPEKTAYYYSKLMGKQRMKGNIIHQQGGIMDGGLWETGYPVGGQIVPTKTQVWHFRDISDEVWSLTINDIRPDPLDQTSVLPIAVDTKVWQPSILEAQQLNPNLQAGIIRVNGDINATGERWYIYQPNAFFAHA